MDGMKSTEEESLEEGECGSVELEEEAEVEKSLRLRRISIHQMPRN